MLGEQIVVDLQLSPALQPTVVDAVQLEAALTNLATNARDAMPRGGQLSFVTRNVTLPGGGDVRQESGQTVTISSATDARRLRCSAIR